MIATVLWTNIFAVARKRFPACQQCKCKILLEHSLNFRWCAINKIDFQCSISTPTLHTCVEFASSVGCWIQFFSWIECVAKNFTQFSVFRLSIFWLRRVRFIIRKIQAFFFISFIQKWEEMSWNNISRSIFGQYTWNFIISTNFTDFHLFYDCKYCSWVPLCILINSQVLRCYQFHFVEKFFLRLLNKTSMCLSCECRVWEHCLHNSDISSKKPLKLSMICIAVSWNGNRFFFSIVEKNRTRSIWKKNLRKFVQSCQKMNFVVYLE